MADSRSVGNKDNGFKETHVPNMSVLVHCRTVVEKKDYVSTGVLTYAEGDMVEVEIGDFQLFALGSIVKLTVYTPAGMFMFNTTVIAKEEGYLILINPPENKRKFLDKRKETRVEMNQIGHICGLWTIGSKEKLALVKPIIIAVKNISQCGIGLTVIGELTLSAGEHIEITADIGITINCVVKIIRKDLIGDEIQYGAEIVNIPNEQNIALRAYILKSQVELRSSLKRTETQKRVFK